MRAHIHFAVSALSFVAMTGCSWSKPMGLTIEGYNYTNRYIDSFTATDEEGNGAWGGNVFLSSPTSGGGGGTCCVMLEPKARKPVRLRIDWPLDRVDDVTGHAIAPQIKKQSWITANPPFPTDPKNFEVHFYQDGHVEVALTHWLFPPRISLPEARRATL